ncbi:MAG: hypothetical protein KGI89_13990, partial [Euryarchaeota archaeon]|nr:hypothetical protein [Euryarchaeota archaeon]
MEQPLDPREGPLSAGIREVLDRLEEGSGSLLLVSGGDAATREEHLRSIEREARDRRLKVERLRASTFDQEVPFGALLGWLAGMVPLARQAPEEERAAWIPSIALAGLRALDRPEDGEAVSSGAGPPDPRPSEDDLPPVPPEEMRVGVLGLVESMVRQRRSVVAVSGAEHLDPSSREWLLRLVPALEALPLVMVLEFSEEGDDLTFWRTGEGRKGRTWHRLPTPERPSSPQGPVPSSARTLPLDPLRIIGGVTVAGPDARLELLAEVLGMSREKLRSELRRQVSEGWLVEDPPGWAPARRPLGEAALRALGPAAVARLHHALAEALERSNPQPRGKLLFRIGEHWEQAGVLSPGVERLIESAHECERWGALEEGERRFQRALLLAQNDPSERGRRQEEKVYDQLASLRLRSESPEKATEALRRALGLAQARGAPAREWATYVAGIANAEISLGADPGPELTSALARVGDRSPEAEAVLLRAHSLYLSTRGRPQEAVEVGERACELAERTQAAGLKVRCRSTVANAYLFSGQSPERARLHLLRALQFRRSIQGTPDQTLLIDALDRLALVEFNLRNYRAAFQRGEETLREGRRLGSRTSVMHLLGNVGEYACAAQAYDRAAELTLELRTLCDRFGTPPADDNRLQLLLVEAAVAAGRGDLKLARERLDELVAAAEKGGVRYFLAQGLVAQAVLADRAGDLSLLRSFLRRLRKEG